VAAAEAAATKAAAAAKAAAAGNCQDFPFLNSFETPGIPSMGCRAFFIPESAVVSFEQRFLTTDLTDFNGFYGGNMDWFRSNSFHRMGEDE
jgi:hypothetical protein